jgi:hypothetical protein
MNNCLERLAIAGWRGLIRISERSHDERLDTIWNAQLLASDSGVKRANPAGAKPFGRCG